MFKISFTDKYGNDFLGTTNHFTTDGRYSFDTIDAIARDTASKLLDNKYIYGYIIRRGSFNNRIIKTVTIK